MINYRSFFEGKRDEIDALTKIYRRDVMFEYVQFLISNNVPFTYAILDIDNFKYINDNYGHPVGDVVLENVAKQIRECIGDSGIIGRYGGDEFIIILENITEYDDQWQHAHDILKSPKKIEQVGFEDITFTYTIGIAKFPFDATDIDNLVGLADKALYRGKTKGRNCFIIYLEWKHKNIDLKSERDKSYSQMYLQCRIYNSLTSATSPRKGIDNTLNFLGSYLMIDHLCLENDGKICASYIHPLGKNIALYPIGNKLLLSTCNNTNFCYENSVSESVTRSPYYATLIEQKINANVVVGLWYNKKILGFLRADMVEVGTGRIWQQRDITLLISTAQIITMMLVSRRTTLQELCQLTDENESK